MVACSDGVMDVKYAIFSSITECEKLQSDTLEGATFQQETDPSKDPHLKELTFEEFFAGRFYCTEFEFVIYAYKFEDTEASKEYFENVTGIKTDRDLNFNFITSTGAFRSKTVVFYNENAYLIQNAPEDWREIKVFLNEIFTIQLPVTSNSDGNLKN